LRPRSYVVGSYIVHIPIIAATTSQRGDRLFVPLSVGLTNCLKRKLEIVKGRKRSPLGGRLGGVSEGTSLSVPNL